MDSRHLHYLAGKLKTLKDNKKDIEDVLEVLTVGIEKVEQELLDITVQEETETGNAGRVYWNTKVYASMVADMKDQLQKVLKQYGKVQ
jgi:hypothetical protein